MKGEEKGVRQVEHDTKDMIEFILHTGRGLHGEMLKEGHVEENAKIINTIISGPEHRF
ncbi:MAG: hypothetical protein GY940_38380 [bacterium]|nr:hypothetical protein [bacterium]